MKKVIYCVVLLLLIVSFSSCQFGYDNWPVEKTYILSSVNLFVCNEETTIRIETKFPASVYNPNAYSIDISVSGEQLITIPSHEVVTIDG